MSTNRKVPSLLPRFGKFLVIQKVNIITEIKVAAPAAHAWLVIGDKFGEIGQIITRLESSFLEGALGVRV